MNDSSLKLRPGDIADDPYRCQRKEVVVLGASVAESKTTTEDATRRIHRLSTDEYAALQRDVGARIVCVEGQWWRQVRPCFFRPLLPYREFPTAWAVPLSARLGGAQHVVPCGQQANSTMSFLMFTDGADYSLDSLRSKTRRQVRGAAEQFTVSSIIDRASFREHAYPVYAAFHARTRYRYLAERSRKRSFEKWADTIFEFQSSLILGAWRGPELCAVSIAHAIEDTLIYSTFFATDAALHDHVASLLLHEVRARASQDTGIAQVYAGIPKPAEGHGIDEFLMRRGCQVVTKPAFLWLNPASKLLLRWLFTDQYARLRGEQVESKSLTLGPGESSSTE
jgi:hypothetical protein